MKFIATVLLFLITCGCMSTRVVFSEKFHLRNKPSYVDYFDSYWAGLKGHPQVALQKVCLDQQVHAFERVKTAEDGILTAITLGIYSPSTVKIWCGE